MPRVSSENRNTEDTKTRSVRRRVSKTTNLDTAPKPRRKAPTRFVEASSTAKKSSFKPKYAVLFLVGFVTVGTTIFIGYSDGGQIDVSARVAEQRNLAGANYANNNPDGSVTVPVQNSAPPVVTHSQLRPKGVDVTKLSQPAEVPAENASSTEEVATSSDPLPAEESNPGVNEPPASEDNQEESADSQ